MYTKAPLKRHTIVSHRGDVSAMIVTCRIHIRTHVGNSQDGLRGGYDSSLQKNVNSSDQ